VCRVATAEFEAGLPSANRSRRWVGALLARWGLEELTDTATLLTSELVTNAVVHAHSRPVVSLAVASGVVEIGVRDREPRMPRHSHPPQHELAGLDARAFMTEGGRGLFLVDALAHEWGATSLATGKQVWLRLDAAGWSFLPDCRCDEPGSDRVVLDSGLAARANPGP
jgi:anti-sigma regulatory factor (Ser/Thr protein kinase)